LCFLLLLSLYLFSDYFLFYPLYLATTLFVSFFFYFYPPLRDLHSFPTRRSSDLYRPHLCRNDERSDELLFPRGFCFCTDVCRCIDRKSTRLNSSHVSISYAVFCLKKKNKCVRTIFSYHSRRMTTLCRSNN